MDHQKNGWMNRYVRKQSEMLIIESSGGLIGL